MTFARKESRADHRENTLPSCNLATLLGGKMRDPGNKFVWAQF